MTSSNKSIHVTCARCGQYRLHDSRGLCKYCYRTVSKNGTRELYPRRKDARLVALDPDVEAADLVREVLERLHKQIADMPTYWAPSKTQPEGAIVQTLSRAAVLELVLKAGRP